MPLPQPREGDSYGFKTHVGWAQHTTLGTPEKKVWSSIRHLVASDVAEGVLNDVHGIRSIRKRATIAQNIALYVQQAYEFYEAAGVAKANTAPLFYYYSFLHLAKAFCEINNPQFHYMPASRLHGLSYKPNSKRRVNMNTEFVSLARRGVWHVFLESIQKQAQAFPNPFRLRVADLFALCPEILTEYQLTYRNPPRLVELVDPDLLVDVNTNEVWVRFSVKRDDLKNNRLTRNTFLNLITVTGSNYQTVLNGDKFLWTFEFRNPKKFTKRYKKDLFELVENEIRAMNLAVAPRWGNHFYAIPIHTRNSMKLPQIIVLYTLIFWLGSLVRYDPHSVAYLQNSGYWSLIDGFMNQSRIWLLELFEWELYRTETVLQSAR